MLRTLLLRLVGNTSTIHGVALRIPPLFSASISQIHAKALWAEKEDDDALVHKDLQITKSTLREVCSQSYQLLKLRKGIFMHTSLGEPFLSNLEAIKEMGLPYFGEKQLILQLSDLLMHGNPVALRKQVKWFTKKLGLDGRRFGDMAVKHPWLMMMSVEEDVVPAWAKFEEAGIDKTGFKNVVMLYPHVLKFDLTIYSPLKMVQALREAGLSKKDAQSVLMRAPGILAGSFQDTVLPVLDMLKTIHLADQDALAVLVEAPDLLNGDVSKSVPSKLEWLVRKVGIHRSRVHRLLLAAPTVFSRYDLSTLQEGYSTLLSCGYNKQECRQMISTRPGLLCMERMEIRQKVWFWIKILECNPRDIIRFPAYLGAPFQERVLFRIAFLGWKGIDIFSVPLNIMFTKKDSMFLNRFGRHNINAFRSWWRKLTLSEMILAIKNQNYPSYPSTQDHAGAEKDPTPTIPIPNPSGAAIKPGTQSP